MSDRTGVTGLWAIPMANGRPAGQPVALERELGQVRTMGLAANGSVFLGRLTGTQDVFTARIDLESGDVVEPPTRLAHPAGRSRAPDWSFDGRYAAFMRNDYDRAALLVKDIVTGGIRESPEAIGFIQRLRWLPDESILVKADVNDRLGLHMISPDLRLSRVIIPHGPFNNFDVLSDGRTVIYVAVPNRTLVRRDIFSGREEVVHRLPAP